MIALEAAKGVGRRGSDRASCTGGMPPTGRGHTCTRHQRHPPPPQQQHCSQNLSAWPHTVKRRRFRGQRRAKAGGGDVRTRACDALGLTRVCTRGVASNRGASNRATPTTAYRRRFFAGGLGRSARQPGGKHGSAHAPGCEGTTYTRRRSASSSPTKMPWSRSSCVDERVQFGEVALRQRPVTKPK